MGLAIRETSDFVSAGQARHIISNFGDFNIKISDNQVSFLIKEKFYCSFQSANLDQSIEMARQILSDIIRESEKVVIKTLDYSIIEKFNWLLK